MSLAIILGAKAGVEGPSLRFACFPADLVCPRGYRPVGKTRHQGPADAGPTRGLDHEKLFEVDRKARTGREDAKPAGEANGPIRNPCDVRKGACGAESSSRTVCSTAAGAAAQR